VLAVIDVAACHGEYLWQAVSIPGKMHETPSKVVLVYNAGKACESDHIARIRCW